MSPPGRMPDVLVFDIETIPDIPALQRFYSETSQLSDEDTVEYAKSARRQESYNNSDFLRHHFHQIICISVVYRLSDELHIRSLGTEKSSESDLISRFFRFTEQHNTNLVSWNGSKFDLPVLNYRSLLYGISAPLYWDQGERRSDFRYNNYLNRYHARHTDLMDVLAMYNQGSFQTLDHIAIFLGFPGKYGVDGSQVYDLYRDDRISEIRAYCETDVINTYLVHLRHQLIKGILTPDTYQNEIDLLRVTLDQSDADHLQEFLMRWDDY